VHRAFFDYACAFPITARCKLYTDSKELSAEYERLSGVEFGVLPIPFRAHYLGSRSQSDQRLCIGYFGDVRQEKGFHWLPSLIEAVVQDQMPPERTRFLIQASLVHPEYEPLCKAALERLKRYSEELVCLVGQKGPLSAEEYYRVVKETDLLVCPYDSAAYRNRTSGTLAEAIAAGIPTVVPHGSWLARQQPPGSGETFVGRESFIEAVRIVRKNYPSYQARARAGRHAWLALHSPERLIRELLGESVDPGTSCAKVA
jgi:glycosyltransferase involved in cell wall biosynthesis